MGNFDVKKRVMVKAGIPPSISKETVRRVRRKTDQPEMNSHFRRKGILTKSDLKLRLISLSKKFVVNVQCNYEI